MTVRVSLSLNPEVPAWLRRDRWEPVTVLTCVQLGGGTIRHDVRLADGREIQVDQSLLRYSKPRERKVRNA